MSRKSRKTIDSIKKTYGGYASKGMEDAMKAWRLIYQEHWDTCEEPICATCCRSSYEDWEKELERREKLNGPKTSD